MRLIVAGQDRTADIGAEISRRAARHQGALSPWSAQDSALSLKASRDRADYLNRFGKLLRLRYAVSTESFPIPGKPGVAGSLMKKLKGVLWKLFRYQHDRMAFQQNVINELVISGLDFQRETSCQTIRDLEDRIKALENEVKTLRGVGKREAPSL